MENIFKNGVGKKIKSVEKIREFLKTDGDFDVVTENGSLLVEATRRDDFEMVEMLLGERANINLQIPRCGTTALMSAAKSGSIRIANALLEAKADIELKTHDNRNVMGFAIQYGHVEIARALIKQNADVNAGDPGECSLVQATANNNMKMVQMLLGENVDVNRKTLKYETTALMYATRHASGDIARELLEARADVHAANPQGGTSLMFAVQIGNVKVVKTLIEARAKLDQVDTKGSTPLMLTPAKNERKLLKLLLEAKSDINHQNYQGGTILMFAVQEGRLEMVQELVHKRAEINLQCGDGTTPLLFAVQKNHLEVARWLMEAKADVNKPNGDGATALMFAAQEGHEEFVELLLTTNADVGMETKTGNTALSFSLKHRKISVIALLLDRGPTLGLQEKHCKIALCQIKNYFSNEDNVIQLLQECITSMQKKKEKRCRRKKNTSLRKRRVTMLVKVWQAASTRTTVDWWKNNTIQSRELPSSMNRLRDAKDAHNVDAQIMHACGLLCNAFCNAKHLRSTIECWRYCSIKGRECIVCYVKVKTHSFVPCGHFSVCGDCATACEECPICQTSQMAIKIFNVTT